MAKKSTKKKDSEEPESLESNLPVLSENLESTPVIILKKFLKLIPGAKNTIRTATLVGDLFLKVGYTEVMSDGSINEVDKSCSAPTHDDLRAAFRKLDEHLCRVCQQFNEKGEMDGFNVNCKGFSLKENKDAENITLIGYRGFDNGKSIQLTSPTLRWNDKYEYIDEVALIIEECIYEVNQYLFAGKHQPDAQQSLFEEMEMQ